MKSIDIKKIAKDFINQDSKAILIDGPWGSGKTYNMNEFIKSYKKNSRKNKVYYISLFGAESVDQIKISLFNQMHPVKSRLMTYANVLASIASPIKDITKTIEGLDYVLNNKSKIKSNSLVVFDDLERTSGSLSYISLLGFFNQLFLMRAKIICLSSVKNIDNERKEEFNNFIEKIFDRLHVINESDNELIMKYFSSIPDLNLDEIFRYFENNIRLVEKTAYFFNTIKEHLNQKNIDTQDVLSETDIVFICMYIIKIVFNENKIYQFPDGTPDHQRFYFDHLANIYGYNITNGIYNLEYIKHDFSGYNLHNISIELITGVLDVFLFDEYENLNRLLFTEYQEESEDLLKKQFFFLSDENKIKYHKMLVELLSSDEKLLDMGDVERLMKMIGYKGYEVDEEPRKKIIWKLINTPKKSSRFQESLSDMFIERTDFLFSRNDHINIWIDEINAEKKHIKEEEYIDLIYQKVISNKDYIKGEKLLDKLRSSEYLMNSSKVFDFIKEQDFLLPNLSGDINGSKWKFACKLATIIKDKSIADDFVVFANTQCLENRQNLSLIERYDYLVSKILKKRMNLD